MVHKKIDPTYKCIHEAFFSLLNIVFRIIIKVFLVRLENFSVKKSHSWSKSKVSLELCVVGMSFVQFLYIPL